MLNHPCMATTFQRSDGGGSLRIVPIHVEVSFIQSVFHFIFQLINLKGIKTVEKRALRHCYHA